MGEIEIIYALQGAGEGWITFFRIFTLLGSWLGFAIALMPLFFKDRKLSFAYVATFVFSVLFNLALKAIIARPRPFDSFEDVINYDGADGYSMPSSHAMCGAIIATFLIYFLFKQTKNVWGRTFGMIGLSLYAILVAFSRMILGAHYLSDVVVGLIEGVLLAIIGIIVYNVICRKLAKKKVKEEGNEITEREDKE